MFLEYRNAFLKIVISNNHVNKVIATYVNYQKITNLKKRRKTYLSKLFSCYIAFYIVPYCIRNHPTEFKTDRLILTINESN